jgi:transcriptional regulator with XRE-family HTH domain
MGKRTSKLSPKLLTLIIAIGDNIRLARRRRRLSTTMLAERAGMTRMTLRAIENGVPTTSLGAYANVLFSLGLEKDLLNIAKDDELGRKLQDAGLLKYKNIKHPKTIK